LQTIKQSKVRIAMRPLKQTLKFETLHLFFTQFCFLFLFLSRISDFPIFFSGFSLPSSRAPPLLLLRPKSLDAGALRPRLDTPSTRLRQILGIKDTLPMLIPTFLTSQPSSASVFVALLQRRVSRGLVVGWRRCRRESRGELR